MADYNPSMSGRGRNLDADLGVGAINTGKTYSGGSSVVIGGFGDDDDDKAPGLFTPKPKPAEDKEPSFWEKVTSAFTNNGYTPTTYTGVTADPMSLYNDPDYGEAQDYMQRKSVEAVVEEASTYDQQMVNAAIRSVNDAAIAGKTDAEIAEVFLNDMGGLGSDKPDETGGMGVPSATLVDVTDTQQGLMTNPKPLYDFAEEMANPSITTTELPSISQEDKDKLGAKLRKAAEDGSLSSVMNQLAQDSTVQLSSAVDSFVGGETEVAANTQDWRRVLFPEDYADEEVVDVSPSAEAADQQGLMSRPAPAAEETTITTPITGTSEAQQKLFDLGYVEVGTADGIAGPNTSSAITRYQEQNGLEVTGELDQATLDSLSGAEADLDTIMQRQISHHEGQKNYPYKDSLDLWTIGIGHLIGDGSDKALADSGYSKYTKQNPMPESEVADLFEEDLEEHRNIAESYDFYDGMSDEGKRAILDLTFNMGDFYNKKKEDGSYVWKNLRTQLDNGDWDAAAANLASSTYARQVGDRATTVTNLLRQADN